MTQKNPSCTHCGRRHPGECRMLAGACFICGEQWHLRRDCPHRKNVGTVISESVVQHPGTEDASTTYGRGRQESPGQRSPRQARVVARTRQEAAEAPHVTTGKVFLIDDEVYTLFDPGFTYSYIPSNILHHVYILNRG